MAINDMTRRRLLRGSAALAGAGLLAGCSGGGDGTTAAGDGATPPDDGTTPTDAPAGTPTATDTPVPTATPANSGTDTATATPTGGTYTATLSPAGTVEFDAVPGAVFTNMGPFTEMALMLGRGDDVTATYAPGYVDSLVSAFTPRLDGVSVDWAGLTTSWAISKERLYEMDSDVHLADPAQFVTMDGWSHDDVVEVSEQIAPWIGNTYSANHATPPDPYAGDYQYYTLWEIFERIAAVFREEERYGALAQVHDDMVSTVREGLPPESERPSVAMILPSTSNNDDMWAYRTNKPGYYTAHTRQMGVTDAMAEAGVATGAQIDYETLLEANPDVLVILGGVVDMHDMPAIRERLADDPVASQVTAVQEGRVYAQGTRHQGPLVNLFQIEMAAKQFYPDQFGAWPAYESGPYPELDADERLFDYQQVADLITREA